MGVSWRPREAMVSKRNEWPTMSNAAEEGGRWRESGVSGVQEAEEEELKAGLRTERVSASGGRTEHDAQGGPSSGKWGEGGAKLHTGA